MSLPDILYKGIPRGVTRGFTASLIRQLRPERVIIPCTGAFALATTAVEAGIRPSAIESCDIELYSAVIGAMLTGDPAFALTALGRFAWLNEYMYERCPPGEEEMAVRRVAAVTWAIRLCQYEAKRDSLFVRERMRELTERAPDYLRQAYDVALRMRSRLQGLRYRSEDMWDLLARHRTSDSGTLLLVNPPRYEGGYEKMYDGVAAAFEWAKPEVRQFGERDYPALVEYLAQGPRALLYYATPVETSEDPAEAWGYPWRSVFAARPRTGKQAAINWIVTNQPVEAPKLHRSDVEEPVAPKYKLFREGEVRPTSDLRVIVERREVVSYYRDLLVHRLALVNAERYKLLLLDGQLLGCVGVHLQNLRASGVLHGVAKLVFAMSVDHPGYRLLHKLTLMSVCSSWFWRDEIADIEPLPRAIQTTMLTRYPEVKTARGIFQLKGREFDTKKQEYKLTYYADVIERTPEETIAAWLARWGQRTNAVATAHANVDRTPGSGARAPAAP